MGAATLVNYIEIIDYDNSKRFSFSLDDYRLTEQSDSWQPEGWPPPGSADRSEMSRRGILKRFTLGPTILCYTLSGDEGGYTMYVSGNLESIDDDMELKYSKFYCFSFGSVKLRSIKFYFVDISWEKIFFPNWLNKIIDPTWDSLDEMSSKNDFQNTLARMAQIRGSDPSI